MKIIISSILILLGVGCGTTNRDVEKLNHDVAKIWDDRVGAYTYNDAVNDWGQPDKKENSDNGALVATWIKRRDLKDVKSRLDLHLVFDKDKGLARWRIEEYD